MKFRRPIPKKTHTKRPVSERNKKRLSRSLTVLLVLEGVALVWLIGGFLLSKHDIKLPSIDSIGQKKSAAKVEVGKVLSVEAPVNYTAAQTESLIRETDKAFVEQLSNGITKQIFSYQSTDTRDGSAVTVYGRVYVPNGAQAGSKLPLVAFAPGTTGIGDQCAASLEQPQRANWANYDSLLANYAAHGYIVVTTDYEGMRDYSRLHHYMVGEQEGRALLDAARATKNLALTKDSIDSARIATAGYSQGGHAAFWADKIASQYASDVTPKAVIGFGPVSDVQTTVDDVTRGANINWFAPFVMVSYSDYYSHKYPTTSILTPPFAANTRRDVTSHCIDSVLRYWTKTNDVYTTDFISAMRSGRYVDGFSQLAADMKKNQVGDQKTSSAKLINQGSLDNVILPSQSIAFGKRLCRAGNTTTTLTQYKTATHYNTMVGSFSDTTAWLSRAFNGQASGNCGGY